jgi:hypothetical protein
VRQNGRGNEERWEDLPLEERRQATIEQHPQETREAKLGEDHGKAHEAGPRQRAALTGQCQPPEVCRQQERGGREGEAPGVPGCRGAGVGSERPVGKRQRQQRKHHTPAAETDPEQHAEP